jgi:hypothetical protein
MNAERRAAAAKHNASILEHVAETLDRATVAGKQATATFRAGMASGEPIEHSDGKKSVSRRHNGSFDIHITVAPDEPKPPQEQPPPS